METQVFSLIRPMPTMSPHSLGKSVEWKPVDLVRQHRTHPGQVPTRWGNQLNGNPTQGFQADIALSESPLAGEIS